MLNNSQFKDQKNSLLRSKIEDMLNTVFRQVAFFKFEREVHLKRSHGELTEEEIGKIWMDTQKESLGSSIKFNDNYKYFWAYIPILSTLLFMFMLMHLRLSSKFLI